MTTALTTAQATQVNALLASNMKKVASVLPKHLTPERVCRIAYMAIEKQPKLATCSQASLINAVLEASALGLEIGGARPLAHLLPYKNDVTLIVDYKGYIELAYRSGQVSYFSFQPVYSKDYFTYHYGLNPDLQHKPFDGDDRGDLVYAYAVIKYKNGGSDFEVVDRSTAMKAKDRSPSKGSPYSPWNTQDQWTMWCKTAVRRLAKRMPVSPELQRASYLDELGEAGIKQSINYVPADTVFENLPASNNQDLESALFNADSIQMIDCADTQEQRPISDCSNCKLRQDCPSHK